MAKKKKVDCSELAENIALMSFDIADTQANPTIQTVTAEMQTLLPDAAAQTVTRQVVSDSIFEYTEQFRRDVAKNVIKGSTLVKQEAGTDKKLIQQIEDLERGLEQGIFEQTPAKVKRRIAKEVTQLRQKRNRLKGESKLRSNIDSLINQLKGVDPFVVGKTRERKFQDDPVLRDLEAQQATLKKEIKDAIRSLKPLTTKEKIFEVLNVPRAMLLSFDLSALRQGGKLSLANPELLFNNFLPMLKAFTSDKVSNQINEEIFNHPDAWRIGRSKLELSSLDGGLTRGEEEYARSTKFLDKIPLIGAGVRASERAFVTFVNLVRFQALLKYSGTVRNGSPTNEEMVIMGSAINILSGKGDFGKNSGAIPLLNAIMLAPRYTLSQFQTLAGVPIWRARNSPEVRNLIIKQYARMLSSFGLLTAMMLWFGFDVEEDPTSTDFLKFRKERTRLDFGTGLLQPIVLLSRAAAQQVKSPVTGKVSPFSFETIAQFGRGKLSPLTAMAIDITVGKDVVGRKVTVRTVEGVKDVAFNRLMPISIQDITEVLKEQGLDDAAIFGLLSILGQGVSTFPSVDSPRRKGERR